MSNVLVPRMGDLVRLDKELARKFVVELAVVRNNNWNRFEGG